MLESVGFNTYSKTQVEKTLANTMYMVKVQANGEFAGIGRIIGNASIVYILTDICAKPKFQKKVLV